jgi:hypothetical protein
VFPEERGAGDGIIQREFENLAEYEEMSDSDADEEGEADEGVITDGLHVNHINYLQYYDNSKFIFWFNLFCCIFVTKPLSHGVENSVSQ